MMRGIGNLWNWMPRRFSLRVLLLTILVLCTLLGWVSWKLDRHEQQRSIVSSINGAHASYSFGDVWALQLLGRTSDEELDRLEEFPGLIKLYADCPTITNVGLAHVGRLKSLQMLSLRDTSVDDNGLRHLKQLDNLIILWINNTKISNDGVSELKEALPNCDIRHVPGPGPW